MTAKAGVSGPMTVYADLLARLRPERRIVSIWMRSFTANISIKYLYKKEKYPLAIIQHDGGRSWIMATDPAAEQLGIRPGQALADARALYPNLLTREADPARDRQALERLADWCGRFTPWAGLDPAVGPGEAGLFLDVTGCAHLSGGEAGLLADLERHLARSGLAARLALAGSPGAAWAWSRFRPAGAPAILASDEAMLGPLPVEALRIPAATAETLRRLGLRRIADLTALPRAALAARFGADLLRQIDRVFGRAEEPIAPRRPPTSYSVRRDFAEPLMVPEALGAVLARLLPPLCRRLERDGRGARRLVYTLYRIDGTSASAAIGTSRAARDPAHLARLFEPRLETLDPDPGIEALALEAPETAPFTADQNALADSAARAEAPALAGLIDRLANRLGADRVGTLAPVALHLPERQTRFVAALGADARAADWSAWPASGAPLPLRLFPVPEPVEIEAPDARADAPPRAFRWRGRVHRIAAARGPDRRLGAWWQGEHAARDYWAVEDDSGRGLWLCRDLSTGRWCVHGIMAPAREAAA